MDMVDPFRGTKGRGLSLPSPGLLCIHGESGRVRQALAGRTGLYLPLAGTGGDMHWRCAYLLEIIYLDPHELTPYENNTRRHNPTDIDGIKRSIERVGFRDPIGIWGKNNLIVEGHGRQIAAIEMGLDKVPCIRLDDMTDEQRKEYAIRHNRSAELSSWDFEKLEEEIAALEIMGVDVSDLGFDLPSLDDEPTNLDDEAQKTNVVVSINFPDVDTYERVKEQLQTVADENGATLAVKMA